MAAKTSSDDKVGVTFTAQSHPGVKAMGPYKPDQIYQVPAAEADRLVAAKGFQRVGAAAGETQE